jgi:FemAB-related protein (PEP-CTERM system-associated)
MPAMNAAEVLSAAPEGWDDYVLARQDGSAYHLADVVRVGTRAFGLKSYFLVARATDGRICGVLPLVEQTSVLFGRFLASVPFFNYGGALAEDAVALAALTSAAEQLARERRVQHVELRHEQPVPALSYATRLDKITMLLELPETVEKLSQKLGSKLRSQIKRAERENPQVQIGGRELLPQFYEVFRGAMHELGTPVYPLRFFEATFQAMPTRCTVVLISAAGAVQAASFLVRYRDRVEVPWAASTPLAKPMALNMRLYWEMLKHSVESGARQFDFGRSTRDSGTHRFKAQWGAQPVQLHWYYWLASGGELPRLNQDNPKYALAANVWRKLPRWLVNAAGPHIVKNLP